VPNVVEDGHELAGIRLPEVSVPLGTYTGWNLRRPLIGAPGALARWNGSFLPFPTTEAERNVSKDPRASLEARYPSKRAYVYRITAAARELERRGFLLGEDVGAIIERARGRSWPPEALRASSQRPVRRFPRSPTGLAQAAG
jgi:hypothetical protein